MVLWEQMKSLLFLDSPHSCLFPKGALDTTEGLQPGTTILQILERSIAPVFTSVILILTAPLCRCHCDAHFIDEETEAH